MNLLPVFAVGVIMMFTIMHLPKSRVFDLHPSHKQALWRGTKNTWLAKITIMGLYEIKTHNL